MPAHDLKCPFWQLFPQLTLLFSLLLSFCVRFPTRTALLLDNFHVIRAFLHFDCQSHMGHFSHVLAHGPLPCPGVGRELGRFPFPAGEGVMIGCQMHAQLRN